MNEREYSRSIKNNIKVNRAEVGKGKGGGGMSFREEVGRGCALRFNSSPGAC